MQAAVLRELLERGPQILRGDVGEFAHRGARIVGGGNAHDGMANNSRGNRKTQKRSHASYKAFDAGRPIWLAPMTVERCQIKNGYAQCVSWRTTRTWFSVSMTLIEFWLRRKFMSEAGSVDE